MQEGCRTRRNGTEVCTWLGRYVDEKVVRLEHIIEKIIPGWPAPEIAIYTIELTKDRHLLFYIRRNNPVKPKERIWHYVLTEEGAELMRRKMAAVKTFRGFWALVREVKKAAEEYGKVCGLAAEEYRKLWKQAEEEAKRTGRFSIADFDVVFKEVKEKVGYCRGGGICIEDDATRHYPFSFEDEYLYPPEPD